MFSGAAARLQITQHKVWQLDSTDSALVQLRWPSLLAQIRDSILGDGTVVRAGSRISHSVIGLRGLIGERCVVEDALMMGADYYETLEECALLPGCLPMGLGAVKWPFVVERSGCGGWLHCLLLFLKVQLALKLEYVRCIWLAAFSNAPSTPVNFKRYMCWWCADATHPRGMMGKHICKTFTQKPFFS